MDFDLSARERALRATWPHAQRYTLVDGLAYETHFIERLTPRPGLHALWEGGPDAELAYAGPWLVDWRLAHRNLHNDLLELEPLQPSVCWFFSEHTVAELLPPLRRNLDFQQADGSTTLLRYYDPRVLVSLLRTLSPGQYQAFCGFALEWWVLLDGQRQRLSAAHEPGTEALHHPLTPQQWRALRSDEAQRFVAAACDQLLSLVPSLADTPGRAVLLERLRNAHAVAGQLGIRSTAHVLRWMHLVAQAPALAQDAAVLAWLQRPDQNTGRPVPPEARLDDLLSLLDHRLRGSD